MSSVADDIIRGVRESVSAFAVPVRYRRGVAVRELMAVPHRPRVDSRSGVAEVVAEDELDWVFFTDDFSAMEPRIGDTIEWDGREWVVVAARGATHEFADAYCTTLRVHTRRRG